MSRLRQNVEARRRSGLVVGDPDRFRGGPSQGKEPAWLFGDRKSASDPPMLRVPWRKIDLPEFKLNKVAEADFPSRFGRFRIYGFEGIQPGETEEAVVLTLGDLSPGTPPPLVRIHSQCLTGDVLHSLRCDCRSQLELSLDHIVSEGRGLLIYEHQEGRGIGLMNKLRAYELQDNGLDTVEANVQLGFAPDLRNYALPAAIVQFFGITEVRLLSNNPDKVAAMEKAGVRVVERIPVVAPAVDTSADYLRTKREKLGHLI